jgi:hypothetical protein
MGRRHVKICNARCAMRNGGLDAAIIPLHVRTERPIIAEPAGVAALIACAAAIATTDSPVVDRQVVDRLRQRAGQLALLPDRNRSRAATSRD